MIVASTVAFCVLVGAAVTVIVVQNVDPDVFLQFLAGPTIGNLVTIGVFAYVSIVNRRVGDLKGQLEKVDANTNGNMSRLIDILPSSDPVVRAVATDTGKYRIERIEGQ